MENTSNSNQEPLDPSIIEKLRYDLHQLDEDLVQLEGKQLKPSSCYHVNLDPVHVLFNTNCPDVLKEKVEALLTKHLGKRDGNIQQ